MTDLKFKLLNKLYSSPPTATISKTELLNLKIATPTEISDALDDLFEKKYIKSIVGSDTVSITSPGRIAFEETQEERNKNSKDKIQQRFENKILVASVLVPFITFVLGIIVEHYIDLVSFLDLLFK